jgi:hypothetical protein
MGKTQGTRAENRQLRARVAVAAALWHAACEPKPYVFFVAADVNGRLRTRDADVVESALTGEFGIPARCVLTRSRSSCTLIEVRAARVLGRIHGVHHVVAVTHPYHAPRVRRYLAEVLPGTSVVEVHPGVLGALELPSGCSEMFRELPALIRDSMPARTDLLRERIVEWLMTRLHAVDPRGRVERRLAKLVRGRNQTR